MEWKKLSGYPHYTCQLLENDSVLLTMAFNLSQSPFIASVQADSVTFTIDREGTWKHKIVVREGREVIGQVRTESWHSSSGTLELKSEKLRYLFTNEPFTLQFFRNEDLLLVYDLEDGETGTAVKVRIFESLEKDPLQLYLLALGWYIFLPVASDNTAEFSS